MGFPSSSTGIGLPHLLALPVELKLEIISHLPHDEYPSRACLRRTHSSFLNLIPKIDVRSKLRGADLSDQLLKTELEFAYLLPVDHYPCYFCARVLPLDAFRIDSDTPLESLRGGSRRCADCSQVKKVSGRSFIETLIWIGCTLEELPMPPSRPRLRSPTCNEVLVRTSELRQHLQQLKQQATDRGATVK